MIVIVFWKLVKVMDNDCVIVFVLLVVMLLYEFIEGSYIVIFIVVDLL